MIRYGIIGCGRIALSHIAAALHSGDKLQIAAVCDLVPEKCEALLQKVPEAQRAGIARYTDYQQMLAKETLDLVAVTTESGSHVDVGLACIQAGCNVLIEKPLALSLSDADRLIDAAKEKGVKLGVGHQKRFNKAIQQIRTALEAGRFGRLLYATGNCRWNRGDHYYREAAWRGTWAQDGGALMNQSIHNIDLLRWMMGDDVEEVFAYTQNQIHPIMEAEDLGIALCKFSGGAYGVIEGTTNMYPRNLEETLCIFGQTGIAKAAGSAVNCLEVWRFSDRQDEDIDALILACDENQPNIYGYGHRALYQDMIRAILTDTAPYVDGMAGRRALEMVLGIYLSAREGRPVRFPVPEDASTLDMVGRFR